MVLRLSERLAVPLRERNALLVAAGFAPMSRETRLNDPGDTTGATNAASLHLPNEHLGLVMPFRLQTAGGALNFISTTTVFGTAVDVTLHELTLETFFPADAATAQALRAMQAQLAPA